MLQALLSGLAIGAIYGLVGMGFSIVFYVTRVINFAEGQLLMVAVMVTAWLARSGLGTGPAIVLGILAAGAIGTATYFIAVRPVLAFNRFSFAWLVSTLGVALILENLAALIWGPTSRSFPLLLNGHTVRIGNAVLTLQEALTIVIALVMAVGFELSGVARSTASSAWRSPTTPRWRRRSARTRRSSLRLRSHSPACSRESPAS